MSFSQTPDFLPEELLCLIQYRKLGVKCGLCGSMEAVQKKKTGSYKPNNEFGISRGIVFLIRSIFNTSFLLFSLFLLLHQIRKTYLTESLFNEVI